MKVECEIEMAELCRQLGVAAIPGVVDHEGRALAGPDIIDLEIDVDEMALTVECERCERCEDEPDYNPPRPHYLAEWLNAIVAGDVSTARMLISSVFEDDASILVCERALRGMALRRAA